MLGRTNRVANALGAHGIGPGDVVATQLPNMEPHLEIWFGILGSGAAQCPINTAYRGEFLSWAVNLPEARMLVIADTFLAELDAVVDDLPLLERVVVVPTGAAHGPDPRRPWETYEEFLGNADDRDPGIELSWTGDARIMFTSGTTGRSKGVIKQHASDYFSGPDLLRGLRGHRGRRPVLVPAAVSLQRAGARRVPGDDRRRPGSSSTPATPRRGSGRRSPSAVRRC